MHIIPFIIMALYVLGWLALGALFIYFIFKQLEAARKEHFEQRDN